MALHSVNISDASTITIDIDTEELTFKGLGLQEQHIEEFVRENIGTLFEEDESLLIVGQQVTDEDRKRSDLVAIDEEGSLVLIEVKRDLEDMKHRSEALESQAIRYAASLSTIKTSEELVEKMFSKYLHRHPTIGSTGQDARSPYELAQKELSDFLIRNKIKQSSFNAKQRIILIASEFDDQTLSSSAWLIKNGVDLSCYTLSPCRIGGKTILDFNRILPTNTDADFYVNIASNNEAFKLIEVSKSRKSRTNLPRIPKLFEWDLMRKGDVLHMKGYENSSATVIDTKTVSYDGNIMRYNDWALKISGWSSVCIYDWAVMTSSDKTLGQLRARKMEEIEKRRSAS